MAIERTITIVKPDAVGKNVIGKFTAVLKKTDCVLSPPK